MIEVEPCPHCAGEAAVWRSERTLKHQIVCTGCLASSAYFADLDDGSLWRKERTCRMDGPDPVYWRCTSCGAFVRRDAVADCHRVIPATWCPNCRARIERGDEA